ncbi:E3 ubiquitin-protein ligase RING1-like [Macadamia integrifolia]|uniref:E3 ubiquitin-protein ligase RING1-like n=1 Tax=Macadamia integrifolia TaxID=60698 RepID=UPI001C4F1D6B|nr:E3 ubiquitin-protein ligase RING1-like [Macadamia integrifolia]XP_042484646.1 E3 ubiquitin-protein ligase RING1-like [Macadamia integrifolia]
MSSISATATSVTGTGTGTDNISSNRSGRQTYWCHECDMSVSLFFSPPLICPHCHGDFIEEMESPITTSHFTHFSSSNPNTHNNTQLPPHLDPFPILSPPEPLLTLSNEDDPDTDDDNFQIPEAIRVAASDSSDDLLRDGPYLDRLIQHLADPDDDSFARYHHPASTPASKSSVESIPTVKITSSLLAVDTLLCAVCKDEFVVDVEAKQLPCKHLYHCDCILPWLSQHNSCPVCRFRLPTEEPEQRSRSRHTRAARVAVRFGNFMEDEDFYGIGNTLRHIARRHRLVFPVRSTAATADSTQMAQAETSSAGPANSGETVSSWPVEGGSGTLLRGGGGVSDSATRRDDDGDTVMSEIRAFFD